MIPQGFLAAFDQSLIPLKKKFQPIGFGLGRPLSVAGVDYPIEDFVRVEERFWHRVGVVEVDSKKSTL